MKASSLPYAGKSVLLPAVGEKKSIRGWYRYIYDTNPAERIMPCDRGEKKNEDGRDSPGRLGGWKAAAGWRFCIICLGSFLGLADGSSTPPTRVHTYRPSIHRHTLARIPGLVFGWYGILGAGNSAAEQEQTESSRGQIRGARHLRSMLLVLWHASIHHIGFFSGGVGQHPSLNNEF